MLRRQIAALVDAMKSDDDKEALRVLEAQLLQAQGEYEALIGRLKIEAPEYVSLISVNPLTLADVQRQVVDRQTTLIEYFVMDEHILAWIIDTETSEVVDLPISR